MSKQGIEIILARQLASYLATPCFVFNSQGTLVFYNEPAEAILGQRFEETGAMLVTELAWIFTTTGEKGTPLPADALPLRLTFLTRRPTYKRFWIRGLDGVRRHIASSAFPLIGAGEQFLGAMSIFPEVQEQEAPLGRVSGLSVPDCGASEPGRPEVRGGRAASPQKQIELILTRQLASYLATPIILFDPRGTVLYYNQPGESIVGQPFEESGEVSVRVWSTASRPTDRAGRALPPERLAPMVALNQRRPAHGRFWIRGLDGVRREIEVVAFPLIGQGERFLGGMALFWEVTE